MVSKSEWYARISEWYGYRDAYIVAQGLGGSNALLSTYYDGELGAYLLSDYYATTTPYHGYADNLNTAYAVNYGRANSWALPGYWTFGEGLAERYTRRGDAAALSDLQTLCAAAAYHVGGAPSATPALRHELSREISYCMLDLLQLKKVDSLTAGQQTRLDACYGYLLQMITDWTDGTASYYRPFMGSIAAHALINFYELEADAGEKLAIKAAIETLATYTWDECWNVAGAAFTYTDRDIGVPEDLLPAPDLSMLIAPMYSWLWSVTGTASWKTKGQSIANGGMPVYDGAMWQSGAYLGTRNADNPNGKHINQQIVWGSKYFTYDEVEFSGATSAGVSPAPRMCVLGCGGPATTTASSFDASVGGTVIWEIDASDGTKILNSGGSGAANNDHVATVNAKSGTGAFTQSADAKRPVYKTNVKNGLSVLDFSGSDQWLLAPASWGKNKSAITIAAVFKVRDAADHALVYLQDGAGNASLLGRLQNTNYSAVLEGRRSGGAGFQQFGGLLAQDTWYALIWTADYANNTGRIDNVTGAVLGASALDGAGATANSDALEGNTIGSGNIYGSNAANMQLAHLIAYSTAADATQRANLLAAFVAKWGALA